MALEFTDSNFEELVLKSDKPAIVDFWAEWCPPCRAMAPILHDVAEAMDNDVDIVKVNIEDGVDNAALAGEYEIRSIPNMHVFKGGKSVDQVVGMVPRPALEDILNKQIK